MNFLWKIVTKSKGINSLNSLYIRGLCRVKLGVENVFQVNQFFIRFPRKTAISFNTIISTRAFHFEIDNQFPNIFFRWKMRTIYLTVIFNVYGRLFTILESITDMYMKWKPLHIFASSELPLLFEENRNIHNCGEQRPKKKATINISSTFSYIIWERKNVFI